MASTVIVDTGVANRYSIKNALDYIGCDATVSRDPKAIVAADRLVLPGVGTFEAGMTALTARGLVGPLNEAVLGRKRPVLGVCLGMQLMGETSAEGGEERGLGWIAGRVERLQPSDPTLKVPHVGFNAVTPRRGSRLFKGLPMADFYFVHSYHLNCVDEDIAATCEYGGCFAAAIEHGNIFATQFHLEKSQRPGLALLKNFIALS